MIKLPEGISMAIVLQTMITMKFYECLWKPIMVFFFDDVAIILLAFGMVVLLGFWKTIS